MGTSTTISKIVCNSLDVQEILYSNEASIGGVYVNNASINSASLNITTIGDVQNNEYAVIDNQGHYTLSSTSRVRKWLETSAAGLGRNPAKEPSLVEHGAGVALKFIDNEVQQAIFNFRLPDDLDYSSSIRLLFGWSASTLNASAYWHFQYGFSEVGMPTNTESIASLYSLLDTSATSYGLIGSYFVIDPSDFNASNESIHCKLGRHGNHASDDVGAAVYLIGVALDYYSRTMGTVI